MRHTPFCLMLLLFCCACNQGELIDVVELGAVEKELFAPSGTSEGVIPLLTNVPFEACVVDGGDYLLLRGSGLMPRSRTEIPWHLDANQSFKRTAKVTLSAGTRVDTVFIRQEGALADRVAVEIKSFEVPASGGRYSTAVECFRYPDRLFLDISSSEAVQAVYQNGNLDISVAPSPSRDPKTYTVIVYYLDGWGQRAFDTVVIHQEATI